MTGGDSRRHTHPELPASGPLADLLHYWRKKGRGGRLPARADIDPLEMRAWLGNLMLIEVLNGGEDFLYRVFGTNLQHYFEIELTGRRVREVMHLIGPAPLEEYLSSVAAARPLYVRAGLPLRRDFVSYDKLVLPLAADGVSVDMLLAAIYPAEAP